MSDFMSTYWHWYITIPTLLGLIGCLWLLLANNKKNIPRKGGEKATMGHIWDEDLQEYDNPLPRWWLMLFLITIFFSFIYLLLYPGLGTFKGFLDWTEVKEYEKEVAKGDAQYGPLYTRYAAMPLTELSQDKEAMKTGERLFANYCSTCHGADARGFRGFPNLSDAEWLWGGAPEQIKQTILNGRNGVMPAGGGLPLTEMEVAHVTDYVLSLSGRSVEATAAEQGQAVFAKICIACHLPTGSGNQALGAPNLTDDVWLYGGSRGSVKESIKSGRAGVMPAHGKFLGEEKVHLLAAYVYSLSNQ